MSVAFVFTNPGHHLEMMEPVADELRRRGQRVSMISLAEVRGLKTPQRTPPITRVIPFDIRKRAGQTESPGIELREWQRGSLAKRLAWWVGLAPRLAWLLRKARVVVIPNDAVFPYVELLALTRRLGIRSVLVQEGIRFTFPGGHAGPSYGAGGCDAVCVWGEGSREYFERTGAPAERITVTGAPRMDTIEPARWEARGRELLSSLGLSKPPLAFLSNPIEIQGYGDKAVRLSCFEQLVTAAAPLLVARDTTLIVKTHAYEDPAEYEAIARRSAHPERIRILGAMPIFTVLAAARAAIVMASTVGLEALVFGLPLGVLEIPRHGYAFEYVQQRAAIPLELAKLEPGLVTLLDAPRAHAAPFVARHLHDHGRAFANVAAVIDRLART
ncbi:MAG: hypothetical protein H0V17_07315 [Deltaproteobacteria bacterium]|nr:hypothetical protein [Deltaproteobacteria bacterium]